MTCPKCGYSDTFASKETVEILDPKELQQAIDAARREVDRYFANHLKNRGWA